MPGAYFPPLDKCVAGDEVLISWSLAYRALRDPRWATDNSALEAFLTDDESINILSRPLDPFPKPSAKSKSDFEAKTAAIWVDQGVAGGEGTDSLDELKKDALWLSENLAVEELVCLRVAILEWQRRASDELSDNRMGEIGGAPKLSSLESSTAASDHKQDEVRRKRQVTLYLEEKKSAFAICTDMVYNACVLQDDGSRNDRTRIDDVAKRVLEAQCTTSSASAQDAFCLSCIEHLNDIVKDLDDDTMWPKAFRSAEDRKSLYRDAAIANVHNTLRLLLARLHILPDVTSPGTVSAWFSFMAKVNFFQHLDAVPAILEAQEIQSLTSIVSLAILKLSSVLNRLTETAAPTTEAAVAYPSLAEDRAYHNDESCLKQINTTLYRAALEGASISAPAMWAWSLITSLIREIATMFQDQRESQRRKEGVSGDESPYAFRRSVSKDEMSTFEKRHALLQDLEFEGEVRSDPVSFFAQMAVDSMDVCALVTQLAKGSINTRNANVESPVAFVSRSLLLELMCEGLSLISYSAEVLEAIFGILMPEEASASRRDDRSSSLDARLASRFLNDGDILRPRILDQAFARYPFELSPVLRLCTALASTHHADVVAMLETLTSMTVLVPEHFRSYRLEHEDENANEISLTEILPLFSTNAQYSSSNANNGAKHQLSRREDVHEGISVLEIPSGAAGVVVKESRPMVFKIEHQHSGLEYLGRLLSTLVPSSESFAVHLLDPVNRIVAAELVTLVTALLGSKFDAPQSIDEARFVLGRLSYALQDEQTDIISIVTQLMEVELLALMDQTSDEDSMSLLAACVEFLNKIVRIEPARVWSILLRSSLLGNSTGGETNAISAISSQLELQFGGYHVLRACARLYTHLLADAISGLVKGQARSSVPSNRFDSPVIHQGATRTSTKSSVLRVFSIVLFDVWTSLEAAQLAEVGAAAEFVTLTAKAFARLLEVAYGIGSASVDEPAFGLLNRAASATLDAMIPAQDNVTQARFIAGILELSSGGAGDSLPTQQALSLRALLGLLTTVLRVSKLTHSVSYSRARPLALQLVSSISALLSLVARDHVMKGSVYNLLTEMCIALNEGNTGQNPPSLLAGLNKSKDDALLCALANIDRPLTDLQADVSIWNFLAAVMLNKQHSIARYVLTGRLPSDRSADNMKADAVRISIFGRAQHLLSDIATMTPERAVAMLRFVASALEAWISPLTSIRSPFLKNALEWLNNLEVPTRRAPNVAEELLLAHEHQMAAYVCDILSASLYGDLVGGQLLQDSAVLTMLPLKIGFLQQHGASVNAYNRSLHRNLSENLARKFPGCDVQNFKRTSAHPATLGRQYCFDLEIAEDVLGHDVSWHGASTNGRVSQGFADEFARANVNLSLLDAQKQLLTSWSRLATMLCESLDRGNATLQAGLAGAAINCLKANIEASLDEPGADRTMQTRAELTFNIVSKLVKMRCRDDSMKELLSVTWDLVKASPVDYDIATATEDLSYYRTMLQMMYLAIQPHIYVADAVASNKSRPSASSTETPLVRVPAGTLSCLVDIVHRVVATGFRALSSNLHENIELALPGDFAILTALLQTILSVPGIYAVHFQIAEVVAASSLVRSVMSLYSWSDRLAEAMDRDPIYGQTAITFLTCLSSISPVAEQMATDGVLVQLSSANLSNYFRKSGGKGPLSEPVRMFEIWTEGFLPLCLNLLDAIGAPIVAEVSAFLNSFPQQLKRAESALENREPSTRDPHAGVVTLSLAKEAQALCLIAHIVTSEAAKGPAEGINAADVPPLNFDYWKVKQEAASLVRQKSSLMSRVAPMNPREEEWRSIGKDDGNVLVGKVVNELDSLLDIFGDNI